MSRKTAEKQPSLDESGNYECFNEDGNNIAETK